MPNEITLGLNTGPAESALDRFSGKFRAFAGGLGRAADSTSVISQAMSRLRSTLISFAGVYAFTSEMQKIDSLRKSAEALGVSFEKLQQYSRAGVVSGIGNVEGILARGAAFLERLRAGEEDAKKIGRALGVGAASGIEDLIRAVSSSPNRMMYQRSIFGRGLGARDIGKLLENVGGVNISEEFARSIEQFRDSVLLFRETIIRDLLNVVQPLFSRVNKVLSNDKLKYAAFAGLGYFGLMGTAKYWRRLVPPVQKGEYGGALAFGEKLVMYPLERFLSGNPPYSWGGYEYVRNYRSLKKALNILKATGFSEDFIDRFLRTVNKSAVLSFLAPAAAVFLRGIDKIADDLKTASRLLLSPIVSIPVAVGSFSYAFYEVYRYRLINMRSIMDKIRGGFEKITNALSVFSGLLDIFSEPFVVGFNKITEKIKSILASVFKGFDFSAAFGEMEAPSIAKGNRLAIVNKQFNSFIDAFNKLTENLEPFDEALRNIPDLKQKATINTFSLNSLLDNINRLLDFYNQIERGLLTPEQQDSLDNAVESLIKQREAVENALKAIDTGVYYKVLLRNIHKVDVDEIKGPQEILDAYNDAIGVLNKVFEKGLISEGAYSAAAREIWEKYSQMWDNLPENVDMKKAQEEWDNMQKAIQEQWESLMGSARNVIESVNPIERFKGRVYDAVKAFINGLIDEDILMQYASNEYRDIFRSGEGATSALVGQQGVTSYFANVFTSIRVPIWSIQQLLQQIVVNGVYLKG